jgi:hypothetical protein
VGGPSASNFTTGGRLENPSNSYIWNRLAATGDPNRSEKLNLYRTHGARARLAPHPPDRGALLTGMLGFVPGLGAAAVATDRPAGLGMADCLRSKGRSVNR